MTRPMTKDSEWEGRTYTHPVTGEEFRSVTTVLNAASKPALERWKLNTVSNWAVENLDLLKGMEPDAAADLIRSSRFASSKEAADIGERGHKVIEHLAQGITDSPEVTDPAAAYVVKMWNELNDEFDVKLIHAEATLINRTIGYAGSADLMVWIRPKGGTKWRRAIIDAKTGKGIYDSVALQLVGYAKAEAILHADGSEEPMPVIHETYALHVRPRSWALVPMRYDAVTWEAFKAHVGVDRWTAKESKTAKGRAINAGAISRMRTAA